MDYLTAAAFVTISVVAFFLALHRSPKPRN
jgi:hypothetical protein